MKLKRITTPSKKPRKVEMTAGECKKLCRKIGLEFMDGFEQRVVRKRLSDESVDRDGDIVVANGIDTKNFERNPVVFLFHDSRSFPVGNVIRLHKEDQSLEGDVLFFDDRIDSSGLSEKTFRFVSSGAMKGGSIGFRRSNEEDSVRVPDENERKKRGMGRFGRIFEKTELLEFSIVGIPANQNALSVDENAMFSKDFVEEHKDEVDEYINMVRDADIKSIGEEPTTSTTTVINKDSSVMFTFADNDEDRVEMDSDGYEKLMNRLESIDKTLKNINTYLETTPNNNKDVADEESDGDEELYSALEDLKSVF
jgi:phage head maturation protease